MDDPNKALADLLRVARRVQYAVDSRHDPEAQRALAQDAETLATGVRQLDTHIRGGGALPTAWVR